MTSAPSRPVVTACRRLPADRTGRVPGCARIPRQSNRRHHQVLGTGTAGRFLLATGQGVVVGQPEGAGQERAFTARPR